MNWLLEILKKNGIEAVEEVINDIKQELPKHFKPAHEFNSKIEEIKSLKEQGSETLNQLEQLKKSAGDNETLKQEIEQFKTEHQTKIDEYEKKIERQKFDFSLAEALRENKAKNPKALKALLDLETVKLDNNKFLGLEEQLEKIKKTDSYLFETAGEPPKGTGFLPATTGNDSPVYTEDQVKAMTAEEVKNNLDGIYKSMNNW